MEKRYSRLLRVQSLLYELQGQARVRHDYKPLLLERLSSRKYVELVDMLVRQLTLLNRSYRIKENGVYRSEKSDLVVALNLLERDVKSETLLNPSLLLCYEQLRRVIGYDRMFTSREVSRVTGYKKTSTMHILRKLVGCDKIRKVGGNRHTGYFYELIKKE